MPHSSPAVLSRRRFVAAATGVAGIVGSAAVGGCALPTETDRPDPLLDLLRAAERDARELAAADVSHGDRAGALRRVGDVRRIHAERLAEIVVRPAGEAQGTPTQASPPVCPPVGEVRSRLRSDAAAAAAAATEAEASRAEIAGAISAACTAAVDVELA